MTRKKGMEKMGSTGLKKRASRGICAVLLIVAASLFSVASAAADYGFAPGGFTLSIQTPDGTPMTQAGGHPDFTTKFALARSSEGERLLEGQTKSLEAILPAGMVGNATVTPKCPLARAVNLDCPPDTVVGDLQVSLQATSLGSVNGHPTHNDQLSSVVPVYNVAPLEGEPAAFVGAPLSYPIRIDTSVSPEDNYRVHAEADFLPELEGILTSKVTLFGVPFDHTGVGGRRPLMSNPTACSGRPLVSDALATSWEHQDVEASAATTIEPITGCEKLRFQPSIEVQPLLHNAGSPSGYSIDLNVPQNEDPNGLATPALKDATFTFPEGVVLSPSITHGLGVCTDAQLQIDNANPVSCPNSANIGFVEITSPLLDHKLKGAVYVGQPLPGNRYRIFFVIEEGKVLVKLEGKVTLDPKTGQVTTNFLENPQLPFSNLHLDLKGGPDAAFVNPNTCGTKTTTARLVSAAGDVVNPTSSFTLNGNCGVREFDPQLRAGVTNAVGGSYSPFIFRVSREDSSQEISTVGLTLPEGLSGKLAGIPYCSDAALASIPTAEETAASQLANPSCPAASRIGTNVAGAGAGSDPFYIQNAPIYLAGAYKGAPLSIAIVTPVIAGPFDLGNIVVRAALRVDPETAQITAVSDPLPQIVSGVPTNIRSTEVRINRPDFTLNPTNCETTKVKATITSLQGQTATPSNRFQVGGCGELGFTPKLGFSLTGAPTRRGGHPALKAVLTTEKGDANIGRVAVTLPKTEFLENAHIQTVCTRVQYAADACPAKSIYGHAKAWSPLLDQPLEGPVYLRSSNHKLPDLIASLDGQFHIDLDGRIDSVRARIRNTFDVIPDAPVSKFVLTMQGGKKGLLVNNTDICRTTPRAEVEFTGQNGKSHDTHPAVNADCGKSKRKK
jgi:hypothetical protein